MSPQSAGENAMWFAVLLLATLPALAHEEKGHITIKPLAEQRCMAGDKAFSPGYLLKLPVEQGAEQKTALCQTCRLNGQWSEARECLPRTTVGR